MKNNMTIWINKKHENSLKQIEFTKNMILNMSKMEMY